jgi:hypothetical protein
MLQVRTFASRPGLARSWQTALSDCQSKRTFAYPKTDGSGYALAERRNHGGKPVSSDRQRRGFVNRYPGGSMGSAWATILTIMTAGMVRVVSPGRLNDELTVLQGGLVQPGGGDDRQGNGG